ncbi:hypothetical protein [Persicitalea sp.]|uniref:hypothetical protein n=1 Tax=Persicitalea sp. TaxID=3100273 RepID=UPI0035930ACC
MTNIKFDRIRPYLAYGLILFAFTGLPGCNSDSENDKIRIRWEGKVAEGVYVPRTLTHDLPDDSVGSLLKIKLVDSDPSFSILGDYSEDTKAILFSPIVPFTRGLHYEVVLRNERIGTFTVPLADAADAPQLLGMFPSQDTLPENLLKIYLRFSQPMREGKSDEHVFLVRGDSDTLRGAFLNLQPELWNEDRTVLTLWLDPGRIKRDLQPNRLLGAPLQKNAHYHILVSNAWKDRLGTPLPKSYAKSFVTTVRDSLSPLPKNWKMVPPPGGTTQPFRVNFKESLDYSLITECLSVEDESGRVIKGKWQAGEEEKAGYFRPSENWKAGKYVLRIRTVLEDLAGNNVNRPFDRDITDQNPDPRSTAFVEVSFLIAHPTPPKQ